MAAFLDGCRFNPTAGGATDWTYSSAVAGYQSPAAAGVVNGRLYKYRAESADLSQWEMGEGAYNTGTSVLARTQVLFNSSGTGTAAGQSGAGTRITFSTVPQVAVVALKEDLLSIEEANSFSTLQQAQARTNIGINQTISIGTAVDLNTITNPGTYSCNDGTCTNGPTVNGQWYIDVLIYSAVGSGYLMQRATSLLADATTYTRVMLGNVWQPWQTVVTSSKNYASVETNSTDLNTLVTGGFYFIESSCTNQPVAATQYYLLVQKYPQSANYVQQTAWDITASGGTWTRNQFNGSWTGWVHIPALAASNTWTGTNQFSSDVYFRSGRPFADVKAWGAVGDGSTDDTASVQAALTFIYSTYGGGIVFFPPGNYKTTSPLTVKGGTRLVGASRIVTLLGSTTTNTNVINFDSTCTYAGLENLYIVGYQGASPTSAAVNVANNVPVVLKDSHIWGGAYGLQTGGVDGYIENCYIGGQTTNIISNGANWYIRCKIDSIALGSPTNGFLQGTYFTTGVAENHFLQCDFSGTYTNSVTINDGATSSAVSVFEGCVFSKPVVITNAKLSMFSTCEFGSSITVNSNPTTFTGNVSFSAVVVSGAGKILAGNYNLT